MMDSNKHGEPYCDECGLLQPKGAEMREIDMKDEPDVWICEQCHSMMMSELAHL
jgi:hypothetical protein